MTTEHATSIPTGRVRRTVQIGGLLGAEVARTYRTKAVNLMRSHNDRSAADARRRLEAATHLVDVLGEMKGPAMKLGQMASILDFNGLPPGEVEELQTKLGELRDRAPQVSFNHAGLILVTANPCRALPTENLSNGTQLCDRRHAGGHGCRR